MQFRIYVALSAALAFFTAAAVAADWPQGLWLKESGDRSRSTLATHRGMT